MQGLVVNPCPRDHRLPSLPSLPEPYLVRPELLALVQDSRQKLCVLCAPAGYGKSILLSASMRQLASTEQVVWLALEGQPVSLNDLCLRIMTGLGLGSSQGQVPSVLLRFFASTHTPVRLVLDDVPARMSVELNQWFDQLLQLPLDNVQLLISCRQRPDWNLPRLSLQGELLELDSRHLALSHEAFQCLVQQRASSMSAVERQALWHSTAGWIAGVCLSLADSTPSDELWHVRQYLDHEVLARLNPDECQMLYGLAHLPRFSAELCSQLWEEHAAAQRLCALIRGNAFIIEYDGKGVWHAMLPIVAEALKDRMDSALLVRLRLQSCRLLSIAGHLNEAIEQALLAEQPEVAASYMERLEPTWKLADRYLHQLVDWREQVPAQLLESTPRLIYLSALTLVYSGRLGEAQRCLEQLGRFLPYPTQEGSMRLLAHWQALHGVLQAARGHATEADQSCTQALVHLPPGDWLSALLCYSTLARIAMARGEVDRGQGLLLEAVELARRGGSVDGEVLINTDRLCLMLLQGDVDLAEGLLEECIEWRSRTVREQDPLQARLLFLQGDVHLLRGRLQESEAILQAGLLRVQKCDAPFILYGYLSLAEVASRRGEHAQAMLYIDKAQRRMQRGNIDNVCYASAVTLQTLRNLARQNNWARVLSTGIGMVRDLQDPRTLVAPLHLPSLPQEVQLLLARAELESGCHEQARRRLHALIEQCARFRFLPLEAEARAVLARLPDDYQTPVCEGDSCLEELTVREVSVLRLLAKGMTNQEIADNLFLSVNTVKFHAKNINGKLGTSRRTQAIDLARGMGILA